MYIIYTIYCILYISYIYCIYCIYCISNAPHTHTCSQHIQNTSRIRIPVPPVRAGSGGFPVVPDHGAGIGIPYPYTPRVRSRLYKYVHVYVYNYIYAYMQLPLHNNTLLIHNHTDIHLPLYIHLWDHKKKQFSEMLQS